MSSNRKTRSWKNRLTRGSRDRRRNSSSVFPSTVSHRYRPWADFLEDRRLLTQTLNINGTASADTILFDYVSTLNQIQYSVNGALSVVNVPPDLSSIVISGLGSDDTIRVYREPGLPLVIDGGSGNDQIIIGQDAGQLSSLAPGLSNIEVRGGDGNQDTVLVLDNASTFDIRPYVISSDLVARVNVAGFGDIVGLDSIERINVASSPLGTEFRIGFIDAGHTVSITDAGGVDTLIFGGEVGNSLDSFQGTFEYDSLGTGGGSAIFHDEASLFAGEYQISSTSTQTVLSRDGVVWKFRDTSDFSLYSGAGGARFKVESTQAGTSWHIDAGGGNDILRVTPGRRYSPFLVEGGRLNTIRGPVNFLGGPGNDEASFDDQFSSTGLDYELTDTRIAWSGPAGAANAEITLDSVSARTIVTGLGPDDLVVGSALHGDQFNEVSADIDILNAGGADTVSLYDKAALQGGDYFLDETSNGGITEYTFRKSLVIPGDPFPLVFFSGLVTMRGDIAIEVYGSRGGDFHVDISTARGVYLESNSSFSIFWIDASGLATGSFVIDADYDPFVPSHEIASRVVVTGTESDKASFLPGRLRTEGRLTINQNHTIELRNVKSLFVEGFDEVSFTTPRGQDELWISPTTWDSPWFFEGDPYWASVRGTSGIVEITDAVEPRMLEFNYRDIGTLIVNTVINDGLDGPGPSPAVLAFNDVVTLRQLALQSRFAETLRVVMGIGNDRFIDETLLYPLPNESRGTLVTNFLTPVTHVVAGSAFEVQLGSFRAIGEDGDLLHEVHATGPSRYVLPDPQSLVTFNQSNVGVELDAGSEGRQLLRSSHSLSTWEFETTPTGQLKIQATGDSLVAIIAILTPMPPLLRGGLGADSLGIRVDSGLTLPPGASPIGLEGFDGADTITFEGLSQIGQGVPVATNFQVDASNAFGTVDPRILIELLVHLGSGIGLFTLPSGGDGITYPKLGFAGHGLANDSLQAFSPNDNGWTSIELLVRKLNIVGIELLVSEAFDLIRVRPELDGGLLAEAEIDGISTMNVRTDNVTRNVALDALRAEIMYPEPDFRPVSFDSTRAVELLVKPKFTEIIGTFMPQIDHTVTPTLGRVQVGNWNVDQDPYALTRLVGSDITSRISGDFRSDDRELSIEHLLTGSTSAVLIDGARLNGMNFRAEGFAEAINQVAADIRNSVIDGNVRLNYEGAESGENFVVTNVTGTQIGSGGSLTTDIRTGGSPTTVLDLSSNNTTLGGSWQQGLDTMGGPAVVLSGAAVNRSADELVGIIGILKPPPQGIIGVLMPPPEEIDEVLFDGIIVILHPGWEANLGATYNLLGGVTETPGTLPAIGTSLNRVLNFEGTGEVLNVAYDTTIGGTFIDPIALSGEMMVVREGNVIVGNAPLLGTGIETDLPAHLCFVTNTNDSGPGSLRAAIERANEVPDGFLPVIAFAIPATDPGFRDVDGSLPGGDAAQDVFNIRIMTPLPALTRRNIVINGQSQQTLTGNSNSRGPEIVLAGHLAGPAANGLDIRSFYNRVHSLNIQGFGGNGIFLSGNGNIITGSYIGTDATGTSASQSTAGLVSLWSAEGNADDSIGGNDGTLVNGTTFAPGRSGQAFRFDGVNDYVATPLVVDYTSGVTFELWVSTIGDGGNTLMAGGGGATADRGMGLFLEGGRPGLGGTKNTPGSPNFVIHPNISIIDGQFHHIVATWTGDTSPDGVKLYLDGQLVGTATAATSIATDGTPLYLGDHPNYYLPFRGMIDEPAVYGRVLSESEVAARFQYGGQGTANGGSGVRIENGDGNRIGGTQPGEGNVISANGRFGVAIEGNSFAWPGPGDPPFYTDYPDFFLYVGNSVVGNIIGLGADGSTALGNGSPGSGAGVFVVDSSHNLIDGNTVSGNQGEGIVIQRGHDNRIENNFIGTTADGMAAAGNATQGILIMEGSQRNDVIGNVISGNLRWGINVAGPSSRTQSEEFGSLLNTFFNSWTGYNNQQYRDNFGYVNSNFTQGTPGGEAGGTFARASTALGETVDHVSYYADTDVGRFTLNDPMQATGELIFTALNSYNGSVEIGYLNTASADANLYRNILSLRVTEPSPHQGTTGIRVNAEIVLANGTRVAGAPVNAGPGLQLNVPYTWELHYDPSSGANGQGRLEVKIFAEGALVGTSFVSLTAAHRSVGADFDAFGLHNGGQSVHSNSPNSITLYVDNLRYTHDAVGHTIQGNFIGTNKLGTGALPNNGGVSLVNAASSKIGGTEPGQGNVISGNYSNGIEISGGSGHILQGNFIGTTHDGMGRLGNGQNGIYIGNSSLNVIGGSEPGAGNVIGDNHTGVTIFGPRASGNQMQGNLIGLTITGEPTLGNRNRGVGVIGNHGFQQGAPGNIIGGSEPGAGNVIAGSPYEQLLLSGAMGTIVQGNIIGTNAAGTVVGPYAQHGIRIEDALDTLIGGTQPGEGNVISSSFYGIYANGRWVPGGTQRLTIQGNMIGTNVTGDSRLANFQGIYVDGYEGGGLRYEIHDVLIGGTTPGAGNVVSGNQNGGIIVRGPNVSGITIQGNLVGTDKSGMFAIPNGPNGSGIFLNNASGVLVGGSAPGARNVISGNTSDGIRIVSGSGHVIKGNFIGTTVDGMGRLGNGPNGITIDNSALNVIGGTSASERNVISGNTFNGVHIIGNGIIPPITDIACIDPVTGLPIACPPQIGGNTVLGNFIGTTADGMGRLGNGQIGVFLDDSAINVIGGTEPGAGNVIGDNASGVVVYRPNARDNRLLGNLIGLDVTGEPVLGNRFRGVALLGGNGLEQGAPGTIIGGSEPGAGNVISGSPGEQLVLSFVSGTIVQGNTFGTNAAGTAAGPYAQKAIVLSNAHDTLIGGTQPGEGNLISNSFHGIYVNGAVFSSGTQRLTVQGNYIGTDRTGTFAISNEYGIYLDAYASGGLNSVVHDVLIGGTEPGAGNVVSGNQSGIILQGPNLTEARVQGNFIGTTGDGLAPLPNGAGVIINNASGVLVGGTEDGARNVISGNNGNGVTMIGGSGNLIQSNLIGLDATGLLALGNGWNGIALSGAATGHQILDNAISANGRSGVLIEGTAASGNLITGNVIGTDVFGDSALGNSFMGVWIVQSPDNTVSGNLISGNVGNGVVIAGANAHGNMIANNFIGTDANGTSAIGNVLGIHIADAPANQVVNNLVSGNLVGIDISGVTASGNIVRRNYIGVTTYGDAPLPNLADGIFIDNAPGNLIGGTGEFDGNVIGSNGLRGIYIEKAGSVGNIVQGNRIGLGTDGITPLGNALSGIEIAGGASGNLIGSNGDSVDDALEGNRITFNGGAGVSVVGGQSRGNTIRGNAIHDNAGLGIDLGATGVNTNDPLDADTGANDLQNHPVINNARVNGANIQINGSLQSTPDTDFIIDYYASSSADPTGYGEGRRWIGSIVVRTGLDGFVEYQFLRPPTMVARDEWVTATATALLSGSTSEFSNARQVLGKPAGKGRDQSQAASATSGFVVLDHVAVDALLPAFDTEEIRFHRVVRSRRQRGSII